MSVLVVRRVIGALWLIFWLYWLANAFGNKKSIYRQSKRARLLYVAIPVFTAVLIVRTLHIHELRIPVVPYSTLTGAFGIVLCAAGLALAIWARSVLGTNWSGMVTLKQDHVLIRNGPYKYVRHPIYSGIILAAAGTLLATFPTLEGAIIFALICFGLRLKSLEEEKLLARQFPQYAQYRREVKALIPLIY